LALTLTAFGLLLVFGVLRIALYGHIDGRP
jgi:hypothetical protein